MGSLPTTGWWNTTTRASTGDLKNVRADALASVHGGSLHCDRMGSLVGPQCNGGVAIILTTRPSLPHREGGHLDLDRRGHRASSQGPGQQARALSAVIARRHPPD